MYKKLLTILVVFGALIFSASVLAATGTIDSTYKYAWSDQIGWINFGASSGNISVTDASITGYAWSQNYGWINMNPSGSGVKNTTSGVLSGYAWGENLGWINFLGVTINCLGQFIGTATGTAIGTINFNCSSDSCKVKTSWLPSVGCSGGGGGGETHNECDTITHQCVSVAGKGDNLCTNNDQCAVHNECNADKKCVQITGLPTPSQCQIDGDCDQTYTECSGNSIFCRYNICTGSQCVLRHGTTTIPRSQQCDINDINSCKTATHYDCDPSTLECVLVDGAGDGNGNKCLTADDCKKTYGVCDNNKTCILKNGIYTSKCKTDKDCSGGAVNPVCGDGACQVPEDCKTCPNDCGQCDTRPSCGDGICKDSETCVNCPSDCGICNGGTIGAQHNECNAQKQCILVDGEGTNLCQANSDCAGTASGKIVKSVEVTTKEIKKIVETPEAIIISRTVSTTGVVVAAAATTSAVLSTFSFFEIFLIPLRLWGLILNAFGLRKKSAPWGVVYDSVTKRPLDPAYVVLKNADGNEVSSAITDLYGRYGFFVVPGTYNIAVNKTNYVFPSQKLSGKIEDELYANLYFGGNIEVRNAGEAIAKNIPMDPLKFDWNEFTKKNKKLIKFYSKWDIILKRISEPFFIVGFLISIISYIFAPAPYNAVIIALYFILMISGFLGLRPKPYGSIVDKITKAPLSYALVRVVMADSNIEIASKVADQYGRYYCLVPSGRYFVKIEKKNDDGSYSLAFTSPIINAQRRGIIKEKFKI